MGVTIGGRHDQVGEVAADDLVVLVAEDRGGLWIPAGHAPALVHGHHRVHRGIDDRAGAGFALAQLGSRSLDGRDLSFDRHGDDVPQQRQRRAARQAHEEQGVPMADQHRFGLRTQLIPEAGVNRVHLTAGVLVLLTAAGGALAQLLAALAELHALAALEVKPAAARADRLVLDVNLVPIAQDGLLKRRQRRARVPLQVGQRCAAAGDDRRQAE